MKPLIDSLRPLWTKYKIEICLILSALVITLISVFIFINSQLEPEEEIPILEPVRKESENINKIFVDLSGSVENPDVYEISSGARLKDILIKAGGLSLTADRQFFARNFNLARKLNDQEKIYIPSASEVENSNINENISTIMNTQVLGESVTASENFNHKININTASISELDSLPGIGKVTVEKIIRNRPYQAVNELIDKKVVGKSVYEKIKNTITTDL